MPELEHVRIYSGGRRPARAVLPQTWRSFDGMRLPRAQRQLLEETARAVAGMMD